MFDLITNILNDDSFKDLLAKVFVQALIQLINQKSEKNYK